jgi:hypothetical protein
MRAVIDELREIGIKAAFDWSLGEMESSIPGLACRF